MALLNVLTDVSVKLLSHTVPFLLRWRYTPEKIAEKIKVRISSEGSGIELWGGELPFAQAWIEITNLSPFPIRFDRIYGHFWYGTRLAPFAHLQEQQVGAAEEIRVYVVSDLTLPQAEYIKRNLGKMEAKLSFGALGECSVNRFELQRDIRTNNANLNNFSPAT